MRKWDSVVTPIADSRATYLAGVGQKNPSFGYSLAVFDAKGGKLMDISGHSPREVNLGSMKSGIYLLSGQVDGLA